jgi:hemerythrin
MERQARFAWEDRYLLGHTPMDETHREFVALVDALLTVADEALPAALEAFARHAEAHFAQEDGWMEAEDFPARDCHIDEHAKVLASVNEVREQVAAGEREIVRELAVALKDWFPGHADYMDSALSTWLVKRAHAGKPLIFRRDGGKSRE